MHFYNQKNTINILKSESQLFIPLTGFVPITGSGERGG